MDRSALLLKEHGFGQRLLQSARLQLAWFKSVWCPIVVAIAYYLGAQVAFSIGTLSDRIFAPFWPPNTVLFCALLLIPARQWWMHLLAVFPAHLIAELTVSMPLAQSLVAFVTNCLWAILSVCGVRWLLREPPWFETLRDASIYILVAAGLSPAISAFGGAFVQILDDGSMTHYWTYWGNWAMANVLGAVTLVPVFLTWFSPRSRVSFDFRRKTEVLILAATLVTTCTLAFHADGGAVAEFLPAVLYSPLPLILWAAIRFGGRGASGAILVVTVVSISQSLRVPTVFIGIDAEHSVLALQVFLVGIAVPVFLLGAAIDELRRSGESMRTLAGKLLRAQDEERQRIARELHDSTGQSLIMANLMACQVQSVAPPSCEPALEELKDIIRGVITEVRTVSYLLHPPLLDAGGLEMALRSYVHGFSTRAEIRVDLDLPRDLGRLPSEVELVLFRVVQEGLTNIWRHSGSRKARIQLLRDGAKGRSQVILRIEDWGKGIPENIRLSLSTNGNPRPPAAGLGLVGMVERLHQIGGRLEIESSIGKTVITAIAPLDKEAEQRAAQIA
jgi:signal transduction histidine kinase